MAATTSATSTATATASASSRAAPGLMARLQLALDAGRQVSDRVVAALARFDRGDLPMLWLRDDWARLRTRILAEFRNLDVLKEVRA